MTEPHDHDPLRSLFQQAAADGRSRSVQPPAADIIARGRSARRRRLAVFAAGACLVIGGGSAALATLLPGRAAPVLPATTPSVSGPSPVGTTSPPPSFGHPTSTNPPFIGTTTSPPGGPPTSASNGSTPPDG
ncbi:hypothetical protein [Streptomyces sp. NPDC002057]|uniref:hypothetical protein n=1 Tax=Streptomyces sp. NPDC002057 TaxID=3154664 RepID=UPI00332EEB88